MGNVAFTPDEVHDDGKHIHGWRIPASRLRVIENKNQDTRDGIGGIGQFADRGEFADRLTSRRRVFASYALINTHNIRTGNSIMNNPQGSESLRAEFIQFSQVQEIPMGKANAEYLESLRRINHENLTRFYGLQINDPETPTMTFLHCLVERATLEEFCLDKDIPLDDMFKSAFMKDILNGLQHLHRLGIPHGHLYAATCLIDINWILKLSNFGISNFVCSQLDGNRAGVIPSQNVLYRQYLCFPPEHILEYDQTGWQPPRMVRGSFMGDMYSVGMIFYMIMFKTNPFMSAESVDRGNLPAILNENQRPYIDPKMVNEKEIELILAIEMCWEREPEIRTTIKEFLRIIAELYPDSRGTLIYQMIRHNEKLAAELEDQVEEKMTELKAAAIETKRLLNEMLPSTVVEKLINGEKVEPRKYESATIMFVQIVGFLGILRQNTPDQVVSFLNDIFDRFDEVIVKNELYKVETTQETYMAAGGVPEESDDHAVRVADASLEILEIAMSHRMVWNQEYKIKTKIGFHTGPVATGVIGNRAKRFCLFGDTVNVASRMQSNCVENKIQTSFATYNILKATGGYELQKRGIIYVKGKGDFMCYNLERKIHIFSTPSVEESG